MTQGCELRKRLRNCEAPRSSVLAVRNIACVVDYIRGLCSSGRPARDLCGGRPEAFLRDQALIVEAVRVATLHPMRDREVPNKLDHARIVVAIRQIMIERREAMALAGLLHVLELLTIEMEFVDIAPVVGGRIHGKTGRDG